MWVLSEARKHLEFPRAGVICGYEPLEGKLQSSVRAVCGLPHGDIFPSSPRIFFKL